MRFRFFTVMLCVCVLGLFCGCKKEIAPPEYGAFYTTDGILQNSHVTLVIESENLVAPVTELSYALYDNCDFRVEYWRDGNHYCHDLLEVYKDGKWQCAPVCGEAEHLMAGGRTNSNADPREHEIKHFSMNFSHVPGFHESSEEGNDLKRYCPLEPGAYRVRVQYFLETEDESVQLPQGKLEAVAYFTVTAPSA